MPNQEGPCDVPDCKHKPRADGGKQWVPLRLKLEEGKEGKSETVSFSCGLDKCCGIACALRHAEKCPRCTVTGRRSRISCELRAVLCKSSKNPMVLKVSDKSIDMLAAIAKAKAAAYPEDMVLVIVVAAWNLREYPTVLPRPIRTALPRRICAT